MKLGLFPLFKVTEHVCRYYATSNMFYEQTMVATNKQMVCMKSLRSPNYNVVKAISLNMTYLLHNCILGRKPENHILFIQTFFNEGTQGLVFRKCFLEPFQQSKETISFQIF